MPKPKNTGQIPDGRVEEIIEQMMKADVVLNRKDGVVIICVSNLPRHRREKIHPVKEFLKKRFRGTELYLLIDPKEGKKGEAFCRPPKEREFIPDSFKFRPPAGIQLAPQRTVRM